MRPELMILWLCAWQLACADSLHTERQSAAADSTAAAPDKTADAAAEAGIAQSVIVFDAVPLTATFQRFFDINTDVFTPGQRKDLGTISYVGETPALLNGMTKRRLDQAYVRTLRVVLLSQCQQLATKEAPALRTATEGDTFAEHVLIKRYGAPQSADVSAIMSHMFGYQSSAGEHRGASDYATLMQKNLSTFKQSNSDTDALQEEVRQQYVLLCMAVGQDTRVYLR